MDTPKDHSTVDAHGSDFIGRVTNDKQYHAIVDEHGSDFIGSITNGAPVINNDLHEIVGKTGSTISLTCEGTKAFREAVWKKAGSSVQGGTKYLIQQNGKTSCLTITNLEKSDEDVYTCELKRKSGTTTEKYSLKSTGDDDDDNDDDDDDGGGGNTVMYPILAGAAGALVGIGTIVATPVVLAGVGFTGAGITAGSIATSIMSSAAVANGGGVAAGSIVATLQSIGATGALAASTQAGIVGTTTSIGAWIGSKFWGGRKDDKKE